MFERFTERARQVVVLAQEEARILKHNYIGTEHILLGLLREERTLAALVLTSFDITVEGVRAQVVRIVGSGEEVTFGQIPFTPRAKKVLELGLREALNLGHDDLATYHLLLGLLVEEDGVAARVQREFGAEVRELRDRVLADLDAAPDEGSPGHEGAAPERPEERSGILRNELADRVRQLRENEPSEPAAATGMFERFTEHARQVVVLAQEEARGFKHNYIGTEHILLGLLREEEGIAARVLASLDITVERVRAQVVQIVGSGEEGTAGEIPFTPRARKVLELALHEADTLDHDYIDTEHLLLALVRENWGVAARVLFELGADAEQVRDEVLQTLGSEPADAERAWEPSFERFTERARLVIVFAQEEAGTLNHHHIDTEHLLLGLLREDRGLQRGCSNRLIWPSRGCAHGWSESSGRERSPAPVRSRLARRPGRCLGPPCPRRFHSATPTSVRSTSCSHSCARARVSRHASCSSSRRTASTSATRSPGCSTDPAPARASEARPLEPQRSGLPDAVTEAASRLIETVSREIEEHLGRPADAGELLVALACLPESLAARTFTALGIDPAALTRALDQARREGTYSGLLRLAEIDSEIEKAREGKLAKIEAREFEAAAALRARERQLVTEVRELEEHWLDAALAELRSRLALPHK